MSELTTAQVAGKIGPAPRKLPIVLCCDECAHLRTKWWKDYLDDDETVSGTSARCDAVPTEHGGKSITAYWSKGDRTPDWCPLLASHLQQQPQTGEER